MKKHKTAKHRKQAKKELVNRKAKQLLEKQKQDAVAPKPTDKKRLSIEEVFAERRLK